MDRKKIWLSSPHMGGEEQKFVKEAFDSNWVAPLGPNVDEFENEMSRYLNIKSAAALSSGTAAIHLALIMNGIKAGDDVICQSFTFSGSANPIAYQQARAVFIDSEEESWNMDPVLLEKAIKDRKKQTGKYPGAVIAVHLYGQSAKIDEIKAVCEKYKIPLIEDAAEALGASFGNRKLGTFGDIGILSFNGNKILTTSGGGMLVSDNDEFVRKARFLSTQARDNAPHYEHTQIGYNYRMSNVLAGIGRGQLKVLDKRVERKREIFDRYKKGLGRLKGISFQPELKGSYGNRWLTAAVLEPGAREEVRLELLKYNIESRPLWKPMHLQPVFKDCVRYVSGVSERLFKDGLCLPSDTKMTNGEQDEIIGIIKKMIRG
ncbi:MAG TPA: DegT/DnrJ/EryC1/StrS family aminotransferase [Clostridiales bacterium]|nr:DegT/DnrJ/EryC1/StrS family aminotransferase [Clostridiales bacterium]HQP70152.1 DegT/DnrJ/EryC1/StrS family aminotransferase [Clostridiales bacterium]